MRETSCRKNQQKIREELVLSKKDARICLARYVHYLFIIIFTAPGTEISKSSSLKLKHLFQRHRPQQFGTWLRCCYSLSKSMMDYEIRKRSLKIIIWKFKLMHLNTDRHPGKAKRKSLYSKQKHLFICFFSFCRILSLLFVLQKLICYPSEY